MGKVSVTNKSNSEDNRIKHMLKTARRMLATGAEKTTALGPTMQNNLTILSTCGCGSCPRCAVNAVVVVANTAMALIGMRRKEKASEHTEHSKECDCHSLDKGNAQPLTKKSV